MEFRRINDLPPYVFTIINALKIEERKAGADVIDLGFGNPDIPSSPVAVDKLVEAAQQGKNHRYSQSRGIPRLREAIARRYKDKFDVDLDPETEVITTIGAKEGLSHLMWVLVEPGDAALVPTPSYPIHIFAPIFAGAQVRYVRTGTDQDLVSNFIEAYHTQHPRPRVAIISFPHNPTTSCIDIEEMTRLVEFARDHNIVLVHDFAYSDNGFDGFKPPSILQVPGAKDVAVELWTTTKSFSMAGWRMAALVGNKEVVAALAKMKSYLDYGTFQPIQIATTVVLNEAPEYPEEVNAIYKSRRDALCDGLAKIGWNVEKPRGSMFVWAPIPEEYSDYDSIEFARMLVTDAKVATSPGVGFGPGGERHVRFALIENEQRIAQGLRGLKKALTRLEER
jgi:alanine-synthesizing transaminase